jgi:ribosome biogenesis protein MAK21
MKSSMQRTSLNCNDDSGDGDDRVEDSISDSEPNEDAFSDPEEDEGDLSDTDGDSNVYDYEDTELSVTDDLVNPGTKAPTESDEVGCNAEERTNFSDGNKRKRDEYRKEDVQTRRKKLRSLPAFASYEDYAHMIEDEPEENL